MEKIRIKPGRAYPLGLHKTGDTLAYSAVYTGNTNCGLCLFAKDASLLILFDDTFRRGRIFSAVLDNVPSDFDSYLFFENGKLFPDPYARQILFPETNKATNTFVKKCSVLLAYDCEKTKLAPRGTDADFVHSILQTPSDQLLRCKIVFCNNTADSPSHPGPLIPYASSFFYCLNVRGFTMQDKRISKRCERGTFKGLMQKIPYFKKLGVTAVELMPIFEFFGEGTESVEKDGVLMSDGNPAPIFQAQKRQNLWGYQDGFYFSVRSKLAANRQNPGKEFSEMVDAFHAANMEIILQFWFAPRCSGNLITECIRFYVSEYHIDGIHLKSDNIPEGLILSDPLLSEIKILSGNRSIIQGKEAHNPPYLAYYGEDFMWSARHFLKGDDLSLMPFLENSFSKVTSVPEIHYICNYDGFTLRDLVTYEHKRNESNGEHSEDGRNDNVSWNCGIEGKTRKKQILALRKKQMLNALSFVFLSVGVPLIYAGDESGNTQEGNNNPYCQDNPVGWTDCDMKEQYASVTAYVCFLSELRKTFADCSYKKILSAEKTSKYIPDISFHGVEAWKPDFGNNSHSIGIMLTTQDDISLFIAMNMYWQDITFSLPRFSSNERWYILSDTSGDQPLYSVPEIVPGNSLPVKARSVIICKCAKSALIMKKK